MAEDQGVNGDLWNDQAASLLTAFGWNAIGASNIDIVNENRKKVGIDRIFQFDDARRSANLSQAAFVEAKCYKTTSFKSGDLRIWINTLNDKISNSSSSEHFLDTFPILKNCIIRNGLIVIWFSDLENYDAFRASFIRFKKEVKATNRKGKSTNNIYVLDNYDILRIASMWKAMREYNLEHRTTLKFYYPTSDTYRHPVARNGYLTLDYMFSKVVLSEAIVDNAGHHVVFYFGELTMKGFQRLKGLLDSVSFMDKDKPLVVYRYLDDQEFRKIEPDVERLFSEVNFSLKHMDIYRDLPPFMKSKQ